MMRKSFRKIPLVLAVCGLAIALTGCGGTNNPTDTGPDWLSSAGLWREDTGQRVPTVPANDVGAAVAHVNANTVPGRAYTLAISQDVNAGTQTLNQSHTDLTIVGIGGTAREIRFTATGGDQSLFEVGLAGAGGGVFDDTIRLTLGNNITLVGRTEGQHGQAANNGQHLIRVRRAKLFMEDGAMITGHTNTANGTAGGLGAAVNVGAYGIFTMNGGIITGNRATAGSGAGGVFVTDGTSVFNMEGGSITENYRGTTAADVLVGNAADLNALFASLQENPNIGVVIRQP